MPLISFLHRLFRPVARRLWPGFDTLTYEDQRLAALVVATTLYAAPLVVVGLIWLALATPWQAIPDYGSVLIILGLAIILIKLLRFHLTIEITPGLYSTAYTTTNAALLSGAFIFGPLVLWADVIGELIGFFGEWRRSDPDARWEQVRNSLISAASSLLPTLLALLIYDGLGGRFPLAGFEAEALWPGFAATLAQLLLALIVLLPIPVIYAALVTRVYALNVSPFRVFFRAFALLLANFILDPIAVPMAALYAADGPGVYLFFLAVMVGGAFVGSRLSNVNEHNRQRTRELEQLDRLSRAILDSPLDGSALAEVLQTHVPGMFSRARIEIRLFPDRVLVRDPQDEPMLDEATWTWLQSHPGEWRHDPGQAAPWPGKAGMRAELLISIPDMDGGLPVGGIYIWKRSEWSAIGQILPAVQSLASQVASVVHQSKVYRETLAHQRTQQELTVAGNIQASFLPESAPDVPGLQFAADLEPARETSGDFFDLIPLWDGRIGVVVADVADKGVGAALYMALSRTLLRTYATEYSTRYPDNYFFHPERVLDTVNQCIMRDTRSDLFVTLFYGILDPRSGSLTYANAGHNPPLWFSMNGPQRQIEVRELRRTGLPVGVMPEQTWQRGSIELQPGDLLVLYTDGITEAMDGQGQLYGSERLVRTVQPVWERPVLDIQRVIQDSVRQFAGDTPQSDDITLLLVRRVAGGG